MASPMMRLRVVKMASPMMRLRVVKRIFHPRQPEPSWLSDPGRAQVGLLGIANSGVCTQMLKIATHKGIRFARSARS